MAAGHGTRLCGRHEESRERFKQKTNPDYGGRNGDLVLWGPHIGSGDLGSASRRGDVRPRRKTVAAGNGTRQQRKPARRGSRGVKPLPTSYGFQRANKVSMKRCAGPERHT
mgnify:CR=1 FL=1